MEFDVFNWVIIPILIMLARIVDVTLGTIRIIHISMGMKISATLLGFVECIIWLYSVAYVMQNLSNIACYIGFATGFALGNFVGLYIGNKITPGLQVVRVITRNKLETLQMALRDEGYGVTTVDGRGARGSVNIIYVVIKRSDMKEVFNIIQNIEPEAFITVGDVRQHYLGTIRSRNIIPGLLKK